MKSLISKKLNLLKALAVIWVIIYHLPVNCEIPVLKDIIANGYAGVDVFIFLSGFGLYHSLEKDSDVGAFFMRRLKSLLPIYYPFILCWLVLRSFDTDLYFIEILGNLTMTGWIADARNQFNWYVDAIFVLYLLAPVVFSLIKNSKNREMAVLIMLGVSYLVSITFWHTNLLILATRVPIFILGMAFAGECIPFWKFSKVMEVIVLNILLVLGVAAKYVFAVANIDGWHYGTNWYPYILIIPAVIVDISLLSGYADKSGLLYNVGECVSKLGKYTFSIYLWHIFAIEMMNYISISAGEFSQWVWWLTGVVSCAFAVIYHELVDRVRGRIRSR